MNPLIMSLDPVELLILAHQARVVVTVTGSPNADVAGRPLVLVGADMLLAVALRDYNLIESGASEVYVVTDRAPSREMEDLAEECGAAGILDLTMADHWLVNRLATI